MLFRSDVIPYGQNQIIQNLEGGIIERILIEEGQIVEKGQIILKINNSKSLSTARTNLIKFQELEAKRNRLYAQANSLEFKSNTNNQQMSLAKQLFYSHKIEFGAKDRSLVQQIEQRKQEYKEAQARIRTLKKSLEYVTEEIAMTAPKIGRAHV